MVSDENVEPESIEINQQEDAQLISEPTHDDGKENQKSIPKLLLFAVLYQQAVLATGIKVSDELPSWIFYPAWFALLFVPIHCLPGRLDRRMPLLLTIYCLVLGMIGGYTAEVILDSLGLQDFRNITFIIVTSVLATAFWRYCILFDGNKSGK